MRLSRVEGKTSPKWWSFIWCVNATEKLGLWGWLVTWLKICCVQVLATVKEEAWNWCCTCVLAPDLQESAPSPAWGWNSPGRERRQENNCFHYLTSLVSWEDGWGWTEIGPLWIVQRDLLGVTHWRCHHPSEKMSIFFSYCLLYFWSWCLARRWEVDTGRCSLCFPLFLSWKKRETWSKLHVLWSVTEHGWTAFQDVYPETGKTGALQGKSSWAWWGLNESNL